jgi:hypothetical protein
MQRQPCLFKSFNTFHHFESKRILKKIMASLPTVKTRLFIISDTHSRHNKPTVSDKYSFRPPFPKVDVVLHTGDLTMTGLIDEHKAALNLLKQFPAELKLVIAGNHDLTLDRDYYLKKEADVVKMETDYNTDYPRQAEEIWMGPEAVESGIHYLTEGVHKFSLSNGAIFTVYASPYQPECKFPSTTINRLMLTLFLKSGIGLSTIPAMRTDGMKSN